MKNTYNVIGLMSGTSLDGLDIAHCSFELSNKWNFKINKTTTVPYSKKWKRRLSDLENKSSYDLALANIEFGHFIGKLTHSFIKKNQLPTDFISSHGHTIFHQPNKRLSTQIGSGASISSECSLPVICDFRSMDIALKGQGAPLVPIGDNLLFEEYDYCLNLGGIANISYNKKGERIAYDICPVNMALNYFSNKINKPYDKDGILAKSGKINSSLLEELNNINFYRKTSPKSIGKEWFLKEFLPVLVNYSIPIKDTLKTLCVHIAIQLSKQVKGNSKKVLVTGGGAYNKFLMNEFKTHSKSEIIIPEKCIIEFKEALIFSFLGVLRWREEINCLKSVTGAKQNSIGGAIYHFRRK